MEIKLFTEESWSKLKDNITSKVAKIAEIEDRVSGLEDEINNSSFDIPGLLDVIYPIGSIYLSDNNTKPDELFGGEWQAIDSGKYLRTATSFEQGGSNTWTGSHSHTIAHTHTANHSHTVNSHTHSLSSGWAQVGAAANATVRMRSVTATSYTATHYWASNTATASASNSYGAGLAGNSGSASPSTNTASVTTSASSAANSGSASISITLEPEYQGLFAWRRIG